jgi:thermostable 8-oxoguanine DNA glycosylase
MIDPRNITNFNRTIDELEEYMIFSILVAGKTAHTIAKRFDILMKEKPSELSPFQFFGSFSKTELAGKLNSVGIGCETGKSRSIKEVIQANFDLQKCSCEQLETLWGIKWKTSRMFVVHSRNTQEYAIIDRHIARWLGKEPPKNHKEYLEMERMFLAKAKKLNKKVAELDLEIWNERAKGTI